MSNQWKNQDLANNSPIWSGTQYNLNVSSTSQSTMYQNTTANVIVQGKTVGVYGVNYDEVMAAAAPPAHTGWVVRTVGQGGRAGRVTQEVLVTLNSFIGADGGDDTLYPNFKVIILSQPQSANINLNGSMSFTVGAVTAPPGAPLTYLWQIDGGTGAWANVAQTGVFTGNTTPTLAISNNATLNGNTVRVLVGSTSNGALTVTSANASIKTF